VEGLLPETFAGALPAAVVVVFTDKNVRVYFKYCIM
jgi:hypothetical protein